MKLDFIFPPNHLATLFSKVSRYTFHAISLGCYKVLFLSLDATLARQFRTFADIGLLFPVQNHITFFIKEPLSVTNS